MRHTIRTVFTVIVFMALSASLTANYFMYKNLNNHSVPAIELAALEE